MSRKNIFEILKDKYDIANEMNKIIHLFHSKLFGYKWRDKMEFTVENMVDTLALKNWQQCETYEKCADMRKNLDLLYYYTNATPIDSYIKALEYYENLFYLLVVKADIYRQNIYITSSNFNLMIKNSLILLDNLNYEANILEDEEKVLIIPKNPAATAVAEISATSSKGTAIAILKYNHSSLKGNLEEKQKILYQIALEYEPLLKTQIDGYKDFFNKTNALLNNLHIRHNNKATENNKNKIINLDEQELEKWYDELYQLLLFCVLIEDNVKRKDKVNEFLETLKGENA